MIYIIFRQTGCYDDFRETPVHCTRSEKKAHAHAEKAREAGYDMQIKLRSLRDKLDTPNDWDKYERAAKRLRNPYDPTQRYDDLSDLDYVVKEVSVLP